MRQTIKLAVALLFAGTLGAGCVSSGTYNAKVTALDKAMKDEAALKEENSKLHAQVDELNAKLDDLKKQADRPSSKHSKSR